MFNPGNLCILIDILSFSSLREGPWGGEELHRLTNQEILFIIDDDEKLGPYSVKVLARFGRIGWMSRWDLKGIS